MNSHNRSAARFTRGYTLSLVLAFAACSEGTKTPAKTATAENSLCAANIVESDLDLDNSPFMGPAVDENTGALSLTAGTTYVVSSTYGVPNPGPDGAPVLPGYPELFGRLMTQLQTQPGLLAVRIAGSDACGSGRTLAVWESEEAMYEFVTSPPHTEAMAAVAHYLKPSYAVTHWSATSADDMTFDRATRELVK